MILGQVLLATIEGWAGFCCNLLASKNRYRALYFGCGIGT